jgi:ABC-type sugar transport system ATPase subunit
MRIELRNVRKTFNKQTNAVNDLNLRIEDGEFVCLLGPSGCGKSTTMLMLAGIYKPSGGTIYFDDQPVNDVEPKDRQIGMVFQSYALYPHMTVLENIEFPLKQMKIPKVERRVRAKEAAELVHLGRFLDRKPSELSGGQQQRVALARALVKKPRLLLLDEPLSNLDARLKIEMREEIRRLQKELGITTVMVTHDQEEAMTMADRVAVMKDGQLVQYSAPMELYNNPQNHFVAHFIGTPPMNFLEGKLIREEGLLRFQFDGQSICLKTGKFHLQESQQDVFLGIRPHDVSLGEKGDIVFEGVVKLVEHLGHSTLIGVQTGNFLIRLFAQSGYKVELGTVVQLSASLESVHLFEKVSGKTLKPGITAPEHAAKNG